MSNEDIYYSVVFPFTDFSCVLSLEEKWRNNLNFLKDEAQKYGYIYLPASDEFNDRIRVINLMKLLKKNMDDGNYKETNICEIFKFISIFSLQVNGMHVTERALRNRVEKNFNNTYMKKLWKYLSYLHYRLSKMHEEKNFYTSFNRLFTEAVKSVFPFFAEFLSKVVDMEGVVDNLIKYSEHKSRDTVDQEIRNKKKRPFKYQLAAFTTEADKDDFDFLFSLLSPDEKLNIEEPIVLFDEDQFNLFRNEILINSLDFVNQIPQLNISDKKKIEDNLMLVATNSLKQLCMDIDSQIKLRLMKEQTKTLLDENFQRTKEKVDTVEKEVKEYFNKNLSPLQQSLDSEFYMGMFYEYDCYEIVHKILLTFQHYKGQIPTEQQLIEILQAIVIIGEALNGANGVRLFLNRDWTIVSKLIYLRNRLSHDVFLDTVITKPSNKSDRKKWYKLINEFKDVSNVNDFVKKHWDNLIEELLVLNAKIKGRLDFLKNCFKETNMQNLEKLLKNAKDMEFMYLYDTPLTNLSYRTNDENENEKNKEAWSKHEYLYLNLFASILQFIPKQKEGIFKVIDVIASVEKLENACIQLFNTKKPDHQAIFERFEDGYKINSFSVFLQLSYYVNYIYKRFRNYILNKDFKLNIYNKNEFHLLEHIYVLFRNGRNNMLHDFWMKDYNTLSSLIILIVTNFKLICKKLEFETIVNSADSTLWWYLLLIKYVHKIKIGKEDNPMKYQTSWAAGHAESTPNNGGFLDLSIENGEKLLKTIQEVIEKLMNIFLNDAPMDEKLEKYENVCQYYKIFNSSIQKMPENIFDLSNEIESIMENGILTMFCGGIDFELKYYVNCFKNFLKENKKDINFNIWGLHLRTPLMFVLSLYDHDMTKNETYTERIKQLVDILIENGADPDIFSPLTLHPMHYAALAAKRIKTFMEEKCNLNNPPEGTMGLTVNDFFKNYRVFNISIVGDERPDNMENSFYSSIKLADLFHQNFPYYIADFYPYLYNTFGETLLISAVKTGYSNFEINLNKLLHHNVDINQKEIISFKNGDAVFGDTPLLKAVKIRQIVLIEDNINNKVSIIKLLLKNGANRDITDSDMNTSIGIAKENCEEAEREKDYWKNEHRGMFLYSRSDSENLENAYKSAKSIYDMLKID